jgi:hypothetical protein
LKALLATILIFGIVIASVVVYSVHFGADEARNELRQEANEDFPAAPPVPVAPPPPPAPAEPKEPEPKEEPKPQVIYVPQIIEKVYVKEVIHTRVIVHHQPERNYESAAYEQRHFNSQGGYDHERTDSLNDDRCLSFTGEARDRCNQLIRCAGNRCDRYIGTTNYYPCLKNYGG